VANFYNLTGSDYSFPYGFWTVGNNLNNSTYLWQQQLGNLMAMPMDWLWAANHGDTGCTFPTSGLGCRTVADKLFTTTLNSVPGSGKGFNEEYEWLDNITGWRTGAFPATDHYVLPNHNPFGGSYANTLGPFNAQSFPCGTNCSAIYPAASSIGSSSATITWYSFEQIAGTQQVKLGTSSTAPTSTFSCPTNSTLAGGGTLNLWVNVCTPTGLSSSTKYYFSVCGSDVVGNPACSSFNTTYPSTFSFTTASGGGSLTVTTVSLPGGTIGSPYSASLGASGGTPPYTWTVATGSIPLGLNLSSGGAFSGTPTTIGTYNFTVQVTDSASNTALSGPLSIVINPVSLAVTTTSLPNGTVGIAYGATLTATGGVPPYTWSQTAGTLPSGISLNGSSGFISGTPSVIGTQSGLVFQVSDSAGHSAPSGSLSITINPAPVVITTSSLPGGTVGVAYSVTLAASGGVPPYTWSESGALPTGITLSSGGILAGTPTVSGTFPISVTGVRFGRTAAV
jgi:hypothetical protein